MDISTPAVSPLRQRMIENMRMRRLEASLRGYGDLVVRAGAAMGGAGA